MPRRVVRLRGVGRFISPIGQDFVSIEALGGLAILLAAIAALVWANVAPASYEHLWHEGLTLGVGDAAIGLDLRHWVNDGLMAVFFFVVGLEIKREVVAGELRDVRTAALPVFGAIGGMLLPAAIFVALNAGTSSTRGWAIPMATDIAVAVGVLALLGSMVKPSLKLFLLTLAIVDDIGAIIVIAIFYARAIVPGWILGALAVLVVLLVLRRFRMTSPLLYVVPAVVLWICVHESGIHATIAGVALGLLTPARPVNGKAVLERLEHRLHPISSFAIVPVFALANAGVIVSIDGLDRALSGMIGVGIIAGLVLGKTLGIVGASAAAARLKLAKLPEGVNWSHIAAVSAVAGIGFTVSLFVTDLAYAGERQEEAKVGVLAASILAGVIGTLWIATLARRAATTSRSSPSQLGTGADDPPR